MMEESTEKKKLELVFNAIESCHASEGAMMLAVYTGNDKIIIFSAEMQNYMIVASKGSNANESNPIYGNRIHRHTIVFNNI